MVDNSIVQNVSVRTAEDIRPAAEALKAAFNERLPGWAVVPTANIASKAPMIDANGDVLALGVFGFAEEEEKAWEEGRIALHSPLHRACRYESEPFWVNKDGFRTAQPNPYLDSIDLNNFEKRARCKSSLVFPLHLPFGQIGAVFAGPHSPEREDLSEEFAAHADELSVYAHRFIAGYAKVVRKRQWLPADCQLTKREVECLRWAAIGKTDKEISLILSRSHATVRFHIQNAGEKLDAVNRSQTIFKAGQLGYLGLAA
ncbi:helix-turn-helix transcriptional regulator [Pacificimonas flava]|uniref:Helix-turn-helix transcriptional regulator n=3 Tax=Sphingosinicellaceae TaxID=2820280 RepID=A0A219B922_9SPHN|nr:autoinducer binding domain-containing protein [Pacificimonas aurantium]OWV34781.1 helix-turn-helix transcriptional regulator [Pacificimonas flava]